MNVSDRLVPLPIGDVRFTGPLDQRIHLVCERHLKVFDQRRLGGDPDEPVTIAANAEGRIASVPQPSTLAQVHQLIPTTDGGSFPVIDYASAGSTWDDASRLRVWLPRG